MQVFGPRGASGAITAATQSPTLERAIDFIGSVLLVLFIPIGATGAAAAIGAFLFYGIGSWTGITAAWAALASQVTAPMSLSGATLLPAMLQNFSFAFVMGLLLAIPEIRKSLERSRTRVLVTTVASPGAVPALGLGSSCFLLHVVLSLVIAGMLAPLGIALPGFGDTPVNFIVAAMGGGWPPDVESLSAFGIFVLAGLIGLGVLIGMAAGFLGWTAFSLSARNTVAEAAGGVASAFGTTVALAITTGEERDLNFKGAMFHSAAKGAVTGFVYALVLLVGAAIMGLL
jgi:hypothetical protein